MASAAALHSQQSNLALTATSSAAATFSARIFASFSWISAAKPQGILTSFASFWPFASFSAAILAYFWPQSWPTLGRNLSLLSAAILAHFRQHCGPNFSAAARLPQRSNFALTAEQFTTQFFLFWQRPKFLARHQRHLAANAWTKNRQLHAEWTAAFS